WFISVVLILVGAINTDIIYVELSNQFTLAWLVSWTLALIASIIYRRKEPEEVKNLPWKQTLYLLIPTLAFIGIIIVFVGTFIGMPMTLLRVVIWMVAIYVLFKIFYKPN